MNHGKLKLKYGNIEMEVEGDEATIDTQRNAFFSRNSTSYAIFSTNIEER